jgi:hypothetical protein
MPTAASAGPESNRARGSGGRLFGDFWGFIDPGTPRACAGRGRRRVSAAAAAAASRGRPLPHRPLHVVHVLGPCRPAVLPGGEPDRQTDLCMSWDPADRPSFPEVSRTMAPSTIRVRGLGNAALCAHFWAHLISGLWAQEGGTPGLQGATLNYNNDMLLASVGVCVCGCPQACPSLE